MFFSSGAAHTNGGGSLCITTYSFVNCASALVSNLVSFTPTKFDGYYWKMRTRLCAALLAIVLRLGGTGVKMNCKGIWWSSTKARQGGAPQTKYKLLPFSVVLSSCSFEMLIALVLYLDYR
jgi:hypothetical protein